MLLVDVCMRMFLVKLLCESAKTEMGRRLPAHAIIFAQSMMAH